MQKYLFYILVAGMYLSCGNRNIYKLTPVSQNYIDEVIDILEHNSVNKGKINWEEFRIDVYRHAKGAQTLEQTYPSISYAIAKLDDHHSYFAANIPPKDSSELKPLPVLHDEVVPENIGYIRIGFCMGDEQQTNSYINAVTSKIQQQDKHNLKGWIIDLRGNFGGNMWPMLAAVGPILGEGTVGHFIYPDSAIITWQYNDGKAYDDNGIWAQSSSTYQLKNSNPYVAVLTDSETASSGEAMTIAFKGRNKTKSFGVPTFGVSTGNNVHTLSDGSRINLTECVFADRFKKPYGGPVLPDVECQEHETLDKAINWLLSQ
jgi:hypothetical protein